jgi:hypothetical protein
MKTRGLPYQALMAAIGALMARHAHVTMAQAYNVFGGLRSRGKGRTPTFPPSDGSRRVRRAALKRRNQMRHRAACRS